jgi:hypothetical protein
MSNHRKCCRSCGDTLTIENKLESKLGSPVNVCISYIAVSEIKRKEQPAKCSTYDHFEIDVCNNLPIHGIFSVSDDVWNTASCCCGLNSGNTIQAR